MNLKGTIYTKVIKPIFFHIPPEKMHDAAIRVGHIGGKFSIVRTFTRKVFAFDHKALEQEISGIQFRNPVGLSAGYDKSGEIINMIPDIGFGYAQIGTITKDPYKGNPKPRLARLVKSKSIVVNYGLKNDGVKEITKRILSSRHKHTTLGISFGRTNSKNTVALDDGIRDIVDCFKKIKASGVGNFYTLNISCPNLYGGNSFYDKESFSKLLSALYDNGVNKPLFIKMPINLTWDHFNELLQVSKNFNVIGLVIGNLNTDRNDPHILDTIPDMPGSMSGKPTQQLSNELIAKTYKEYGDTFVIVGVGGITSAEDAYEKIKRGASLVQLITGLIFEGPQLVGQINKGLVRLLKKDGYSHISEAVGTYRN